MAARESGVSAARRGAATPILVLCLVALLVHLPELAGWVSNDPMSAVSRLAQYPDSHLVPGQAFIDGNALTTTLALGQISANDWLSARLPWWNPFVGAGLPLASEMQPASFFLPFILLLHFQSGVLLLKLAMQLVAGFGCYGLLRQMSLIRSAALSAAILFECNGTFAWYADAPVLPVAFLPLLLWGIERLFTGSRGGSARWPCKPWLHQSAASAGNSQPETGADL